MVLPVESVRIDRLRARGLLSLQDVDLELRALNVLIGPNGAGKSNLLRLLHLLLAFRSDQLDVWTAEAGGADDVLFYGAKRTQALELDVAISEGAHAYAYHAQLRAIPDERLRFQRETFDGTNNRSGSNYANEALGRPFNVSLISRDTAPRAPGIARFGALLDSTVLYHFHDTTPYSALRTSSRRSEDRRLAPDGGNLPSILLRLRDSDVPEETRAWRRIERLIRRVNPAVRELDPVPIAADKVRLDWIDDNQRRFGIQQLSDGTLRALALIVALNQPQGTRPMVLAFDEPELGLHPSAIHLISGLVRSTSARCQIILATQSTTFIDQLQPEDLIVVERSDGATTTRRLERAPLEAWLAEYSLAEVYDKGILGGRP